MDQEFEVEIVADDNNGYTPVDTETQSQEQPPADKQTGGEQDTDSREQTRNKKRQAAKERIDELTRKRREAERERDDYQQQLNKARQEQEQFYNDVRVQQVQSAKVVYNTLNSNKQLLERNLRIARNSGDTKAELEIQDQLDTTRSQIHQLRQAYPDVEAQPGQQPVHQPQQVQPQQQTPQQHPQQQQPQQPAGQVPDAAKNWVEANQILKTRTELHPLINSLDQTLKAEGKDPTTPDFYTELNKRLRGVVAKEIGDQLKDVTDEVDLSFLGDDEDEDEVGDTADGKPQQPAAQQPPAQQQQSQSVSSGQRSVTSGTQAGRQKVKLSRDQVALAHRMGLTPEQYASQLTKQADPNGYTQI